MKNCAELCTTLRSVETQFNILDVLEEDVARCKKSRVLEPERSEWLVGGARHCANGQHPYDERHVMLT